MFEINLVPDVKLQMIRMQKIRNLILFICIIIVAALAGVVLILGGIKGGQDLAMSNQDKRLAAMSDKIMGYDGLNEFLTIQDQLGKISQIGENKRVLSRVFNVLTVMLPSGNDTIEISELTVNLETSTMTFDAQANAGEEPDIDYRVLESFKKSVALTTYDYGRYVDANGREIPTRCIKEADDDGNILSENGSVYARWTRGEEGCDPSAEKTTTTSDDDEETEDSETTTTRASVVRIWRTPQFDNWYSKGYISLDGEISGVAHFESRCITYTGTLVNNSARWTSENDCYLAPSGVEVRDSSNGRDSGGNLVLRFNAAIKIEEQVFSFQNKHVMTIGPTKQNVTDSFAQIEGMFAERASDCGEGDSSCSNNTQNITGKES